ncbi:MAG: isoamylase early set domain-containing protein [Halothiobacillaceae bacterium]|nr:isoamylase early set domain-containing protein [Halothiobacillaceae bacterium]HER34344.1 glycoside hydrolase [Halothiobacillaceae bacterium]
MSIEKKPLKVRPECRVTFSYRPGDGDRHRVELRGDFNDWGADSVPLKRQRDGSYRVTLSLPQGGEYAFRYLVDETHWDNDEAADGYKPNPYGSGENGILRT